MGKNKGQLSISREVIATISGHAACETEGVAGLAVKPIKLKNAASMLSKSERSVEIELYDDVAVIGVYVKLCYGANIPSVCEKVQAAVKSAVQDMTGITVARVNVYVMGISFDK